MAATYTVGDGKTYSTIQAAIDAIPGDLSGQGVQTVEVYSKAPDNTYFENVDIITGFSNADSNNHIHIKAMVSHNGEDTQWRPQSGQFIHTVAKMPFFETAIGSPENLCGAADEVTGQKDQVRGIRHDEVHAFPDESTGDQWSGMDICDLTHF